MAQTRLIQDLVELITPNNNDVFVIVDNTTNPSLSVTKKIKYESLKEDLQDMINVLTSGGTGINASYNDAGNVLTLSVVDNTSTQRTIVSSGGTTIGTRQQLNFIKGSGISFVGADNAGDDRIDLTVSVVPGEIAITDLDTSSPLPVVLGGTNATTASQARANLAAAKLGANSDITSLSGLTTPLSISQGGTGADTALQALKGLQGLKYITNVGAAGESLVVNDTTLVSNEYRGEIKGIKPGSSKVNVGTDGNDISVDVNADDILSAASQNVNLNSFRITNIATPVGSTDAATRAYVDQVAGGLTIKEAVIAATTTNIASVYSGGTLTVTGTGTPSIDGVSITATGTRILVKDQTTATQNGIYTLTTPASAGVSAVFTRATDYDASPEVVAGTFMFVISGSTNASLQFAQTTNTPTLDTDPLVFTVLNDTTIADNSVDNAKLADMAALTIKGAATSGNPQDLTANQAIGILNSGTTRLAANVLAIGSTSASGIVQLYDNIDSTSTALAATAASVKTAYDTANSVRVDVQEFTSSGTWTKPTDAKLVCVEVIGGGGGGGGGLKAYAPPSWDSPGGGGGAGGMALRQWLVASSLSTTVSVTVGAGGAGGAAITLSSYSGNSGAAGGNSSFGTVVVARGGNGGDGADISGASGGLGIALNANTVINVYLGSAAGGDGAFGNTSEGKWGYYNPEGPGGGGAGGGLDGQSGLQRTGGQGGGGFVAYDNSAWGTFFGGGGAGGSGGGNNGSSGVNAGDGGGGGGGGNTVNGGNGGSGAFPGGGGGGGGSTNTGTQSGAGGAGANGVVRVYTYF